MSKVTNDIKKVTDLLDIESNGFNENLVDEISRNIMFYKNLKLESNHYLKSLVQDGLSILDSLRFKSKRYYYFIVRSYIENFLRVLLLLDNNDETGVMKLFRESKKLLIDSDQINNVFGEIEAKYSECCLFVHSNIKADDEVSEFLKEIIERNDFEDHLIKDECLEEFKNLIDNALEIFIYCRSNIIEESFYRNFDLLRELISTENYNLYREKVRS